MDDRRRFQGYVDHKLDMARRLGSGECGGEYSDACVLISALLSGIAADLFPGIGMDRRRFVETWVRYGRADLRPSSISVPLLARRLRRKGKHAEAAAIEKLRPDSFGPGYASKVLIGDQVDVPEDVVLGACPTLTQKDVRDRSYPVVFYEHVRSTLVHEFHLDNRATWRPNGRSRGRSQLRQYAGERRCSTAHPLSPTLAHRDSPQCGGRCQRRSEESPYPDPH